MLSISNHINSFNSINIFSNLSSFPNLSNYGILRTFFMCLSNQFIFNCVKKYHMRKINLFLPSSKNMICAKSIYFYKKQKISHYQIIQDYSGINNPHCMIFSSLNTIFQFCGNFEKSSAPRTTR